MIDRSALQLSCMHIPGPGYDFRKSLCIRTCGRKGSGNTNAWFVVLDLEPIGGSRCIDLHAAMHFYSRFCRVLALDGAWYGTAAEKSSRQRGTSAGGKGLDQIYEGMNKSPARRSLFVHSARQGEHYRKSQIEAAGKTQLLLSRKMIVDLAYEGIHVRGALDQTGQRPRSVAVWRSLNRGLIYVPWRVDASLETKCLQVI
ncbi:hypothetical protein BKA67DRAFT_89458 [Truncatella angustata]|uniref:Uncharacterized protein n=1 Tax=Truncatella angustata TaxID=152316 RepID=A0A9P8UBD9_9PEZI|nr:uncharacterized protein BKA67DRAFT_89458 [Truncatella angustata]KAH6645917.1 hypothetical protein BKA67DRAFT_89458 [Truncatella angustata]